ncbi:hypothetical protein [Peribacillus muralis]|uniref:hypothetical protein n=1 Tax=Peribacillus muralis TaxID=264697 RepID=UPI0009F2E7DD|nr:hypothetical protein [Peribacillus muralis]
MLYLFTKQTKIYTNSLSKNAELTNESEYGKNYDWPSASEDSGIPASYEWAIKANGWNKGEREGASIFYTKGDHKIDVISATKKLDIIRVK